jgi:Sulfotransferase family
MGAILPNFFIVGAPKAGTTALYEYLDQHAQIYMSPLKEPNYFASELRPENFSELDRPRVRREMHSLREYLSGDVLEKRFGGLVTTWEEYLRLYRHASNAIAIGEATPCYLWSKTAAINIAEKLPHAKIIVSLRNPVDRAFSQYLHMVTIGVVRKPFGELISDALRGEHRHFGPTWPFLEFGRYYEQVKTFMLAFPSAQIHISLYEDLQIAPARLVSQLFAFLGVDPDFQVDCSVRHLEPRIPRVATAVYFLKKVGIWSALTARVAPAWRARLRRQLFRSRASLSMRGTDRQTLADYYRDDVIKLASLIDRDLSSWLTPGAIPV